MEDAFDKPRIWKNVGLRAVTALLFAGICIFPLYFGGWLWAILVALLGSVATWEWVRMSDPAPTRLAYILPIMGIVIATVYVVQADNNLAILTVAIAGALAALERARRGGLLWAGLGYLYIVIPTLVIISLRGMEDGFLSEGFSKLFYIIALVAAADVGAYFGGSYFKGAKLAPMLSPNKTWSGFFSGLLFGAFIGGLLGIMFKLGFVYGLLLAIPLIILSVFGDLLESGLKRVLNVKDAGELLPGHGGILDRLDSLMMAAIGAAIFFYFWPNFWPL